jgi:hypothetical protein
VKCVSYRRRSRDPPHISRALPRFPQLTEANCDPCTPPPSRSCGKVRKGLRERVRTVTRVHPRVGRHHRAGIQALAETCARSFGLPPFASLRRVGLLRRGNRVPSCRCHDPRHPPKRMPEITAVDQTGVHHQRRASSLEPNTALDRPCRNFRCEPIARLRCIGVFQGLLRLTEALSCFRPCRASETVVLTRPKPARCHDSEQSTSRSCSTDESVVSTPVARRRHPILPWALFPLQGPFSPSPFQ